MDACSGRYRRQVPQRQSLRSPKRYARTRSDTASSPSDIRSKYDTSVPADTRRRGEVVGERVDTITENSADRRWVYEPGDALKTAVSASGEATYALSAPSVEVLADTAFQQAHCFRYVGLEALGGLEYFRIDFEPSSAIRGPDLSGTVLLDPTSYVIRQARFQFVHLPKGLHFSDVEVAVDYHEIAPGLVVPSARRATQKLRDVRFRGQRVDLYEESALLIGYQFRDAIPAMENEHIRSGSQP